MTCLVLAAGAGRRLRPKALHKPLACLLGLALIERVILGARGAGLEDFYIVTGYRGRRLREYLSGRDLGVRLHFVVNPDWEAGNGTSALAAREALAPTDGRGDGPSSAGEFLLCMADHLAEPGLIAELLKPSLEGASVLLAVDRAPRDCDLDDATKVRLAGERITAIGKELRDFDAVDTGFFRCTPALFGALEATRADGSLSAGVQRLADQGRVRALDVTGRRWLDVDTPAELARAERVLLGQLPKPTDGPVSRRLNRPLSTRLTRWLVRTPLRPNHLSLLSFGLALAGAELLARPGYPSLALGGALAQLASIVDGCDGEVARLKSQGSAFGAWLDAVLDRYADAALVAGLTVHAAQLQVGALPWLWGLAALSGVLLNSYTADKYDAFLKAQLSRAQRRLRLGRDVRLFLLAGGALLNLPLATLIALAGLSHLEVARRALTLSRHAAA